MGLMVYNIRHPEGRHTRVTHKETHEEKRGDVTIRRTTIEEIEVGKDAEKH